VETIARDNPITRHQEEVSTIHQAQQLMELVRQHRADADERPDDGVSAPTDDGNIEDVAQHVAGALPAIRQIVAQLNDAQAEWQRQWEQSAVRVATAIAERVIRRELDRRPEITLELVSEALRLTAGATDVSVRLNPADHERLGPQVNRLAEAIGQLAPTDVVADPEITPGGCRVVTKFGEVDLQIESQLRQIEQELLCE
jgi:flagellar biosynthesis/type III secretory pathway protein FliH